MVALWTQQVHIFPVHPELDTVLQMGFYYSGVEGQNHLSHPAGLTALDATQDKVGFLHCKCLLLIPVQFFFCPPVSPSPSPQDCFNPCIPQPVLILVIALHARPYTSLVELIEVCTGPLLKLVKFPLDPFPPANKLSHSDWLFIHPKEGHKHHEGSRERRIRSR